MRHLQGHLLGRMESLGFALQQEAMLHTLTSDVVKSSEIEGEILAPDEVRSSIAWRLGLDVGGVPSADRNVEGIVELILDATQKYAEPLTDERLFGWHAALFPTGRSGTYGITAGSYRTDIVRVISGPMGRQKIHFEAPAAELVPGDMAAFLDWFNEQSGVDAVLKAGLAHLWFVTIHPFDDGNGRIARAIADMALARSDNSSQRFYSMSSQIRKERKAYYDILERTQKEARDVTGWMSWFVDCPWPRHRERRSYPRRNSGQGTVLGAYRRSSRQRPATQSPEPSLGGFQGQSHYIQVGEADQVLLRHRPARHQLPR